MKEQKENIFLVGEYNCKFNSILNIGINQKEIYQSKGLTAHVMNRHPDCTDYISKIPEIISSPDYIGVNPNEKADSIELIKKYDKNILIGIKLDTGNNYLYVSTLYDVRECKIIRRLNSGRLIKI